MDRTVEDSHCLRVSRAVVFQSSSQSTTHRIVGAELITGPRGADPANCRNWWKTSRGAVVVSGRSMLLSLVDLSSHFAGKLRKTMVAKSPAADNEHNPCIARMALICFQITPG
jgi:hypothetical protein